MFSHRPRSPIPESSLENGDSIIRINGKAMITMESAMSFYSLIGAVDHFDIEVNRSGKLVRVEIRIN